MFFIIKLDINVMINEGLNDKYEEKFYQFVLSM